MCSQPNPRDDIAFLAEMATAWVASFDACTCDPDTHRYDEHCDLADARDRLARAVRNVNKWIGAIL